MICNSILVIDEEDNFQGVVSDTILDCCLRISPARIRSEKAGLILSFIQSSKPAGVCLDLRDEPAFVESEWIAIGECIALLTFCPGYLQKYGKPVICILKNRKTDPDFSEMLSAWLCEFLKKQGHEDVICYVLFEEKPEVPGIEPGAFLLNSPGSISLSSLSELFLKAGEDYSKFPALLFFSVNSSSEVSALYENLLLAEQDFAMKNEQVYSKTMEWQGLMTERDQLVMENKRILTELKNTGHSLIHLRKDAQYTVDWYKQENGKIRDWYKKEYEDLPTWYKWFGHLLKRAKGLARRLTS